ncbi:MAG: AraC family transcriptional regulator [Pyrinomonadaceae bacterium]|nr:AraC family transcriptional regulator [Pyrinomonadaceae bacterium]
MNRTEAKRDEQWVQSNREELLERMARALPEDGWIEALEGLFLARVNKPMESPLALFQPAFCFVAQGGKQVLVGEEILRYDPGHYLLFTVDLPVIFRVEEASREKPYFGLRRDLAPALVTSVMMEAGADTRKGDASVKAIGVNPVDADLLDAVVRLIRLADKPGEQRILAPLIKREIVYRLLAGGEGARLGHCMASSGGETRRISRAIGRVREHYNEPLKIEEIARELGMSVSGFHHHFKSVTSMSPLQFQKQIRLQEARRLMLGEELDAASAGHRVGYEDPAYFSRDYKKLFGAPPQRDIARLRGSLEPGGAQARV